MELNLREDAYPILIDFIKQKVEESRADGVVIGLSGGIDSAVVSKLCYDALGGERVLNIHMPYRISPSIDLEHVKDFCNQYNMELKVIPIDEMVDAFSRILNISQAEKSLMGNIMARCRMIVLFHYAHLLNRIVMGTSNKSELLIGYFTKFGDGGSDFAPIGDLYKTQVRELARRIGVPDYFIKKTPSAGLWEGQTDEGEIGMPYDQLDRILMCIELNMVPEEIASRTGVDASLVEKVIRMHRNSVHKRKMPLIPKIGVRTIGLDWRE